jgi:hypothetical protein
MSKNVGLLVELAVTLGKIRQNTKQQRMIINKTLKLPTDPLSGLLRTLKMSSKTSSTLSKYQFAQILGGKCIRVKLAAQIHRLLSNSRQSPSCSNRVYPLNELLATVFRS